MAVHDEEILRLSEDYPDHRQPWSQHSMHSTIPSSASFHQGPSTLGTATFSFSSPLQPSAAETAAQQAIRRRSSKACDNCRKAKCKCEPGDHPGDGCRNCELLGLVCTFLGPSRKRGPPKGYIDAIESRLHQLEAIIGAVLLAAATDTRASSLLSDLCNTDEMARTAIERVNQGPFGPLARRANALNALANDSKGPGRRQPPMGAKTNVNLPDDTEVVDPYLWQDNLEKSILQSSHTVRHPTSNPPMHPPTRSVSTSAPGPSSNHTSTSPDLMQTQTSTWAPYGVENAPSNTRRRLDGASVNHGEPGGQEAWSSSASSPASNVTKPQHLQMAYSMGSRSHQDSESEEDVSARDLARGIGSLSIDDSRDVRYHGKASGLHLLLSRKGKEVIGDRSFSPEANTPPESDQRTASLDGTDNSVNGSRARARERGGLWHFPPPGLWPPIETGDDPDVSKSGRPGLESKTLQARAELLSSALPVLKSDLASASQDGISIKDTPLVYVEERPKSVWGAMPGVEKQRRLLDLYFAHVHPIIPIVDKEEFYEAWENMFLSPEGLDTSLPRQPISPALLFAMFATASRYLDDDVSQLPRGSMWTSGLAYLSMCRHVLYAGRMPSRVSTVQSLILTAYYDVGVGAMASAWHGAGLGVRTALDIGLNRPVDEWVTPEGDPYFTKRQVEVCRRVWYGILLLDMYISTYIGRPLGLDERDYDTPLPKEDTTDLEAWVVPPSDHGPTFHNQKASYQPTASHIIATLKQRARLAKIHGAILHEIYSVNPTGDRLLQANTLERSLDKWFIELPDALRWDYGSALSPPPNVMVVHMEFWCSVLLLQRPFIRSRVKHARSASSGGSDSTTLHAQKAYTVCEGAANRIISIAVAYAERFAVNRCPAFFTYYIFTASIMHVTRLLDDPQDVQASGYLAQAMKILDAMSIVWPSAFRAYELLDGAQHNIQEQRDTIITQSQGQTLGSTKRPADASTVELQHQTQLVYPSQPLETAPIHRSSDSHPPAPAYSMYSMEPPSESLRPRPRPIGYQSIRTPRLLSNVSYSPAPFFPPTGAEQIQRPMSTPGDESWPTESYTSNASRSSFPPFSGHDPRASITPQSEPSFEHDHKPFQQGSGSSYPIEAPIHVHQRPQSPHSGPDYPFHPQQGITAQHHQEIWSGYSTGTADPFGDPSALSASLYTVPLLAEGRVGFNPEQYTPAQSVQPPASYPPQPPTLPRFGFDM